MAGRIRLSVKTIPTPHLQGDDSWIKLRSLTVKLRNEINRLTTEANKAAANGDTARVEEIETEMQGLYASCIEDWNWVDDAGKDLPKPNEDSRIMNELTMPELEFIVRALMNPSSLEGEKKDGRKLPKSW